MVVPYERGADIDLTGWQETSYYSSYITVGLKRQIIQAAKLIVIIQMVESGVFRNGKTSPTWSYRNHIRSRCTL